MIQIPDIEAAVQMLVRDAHLKNARLAFLPCFEFVKSALGSCLVAAGSDLGGGLPAASAQEAGKHPYRMPVAPVTRFDISIPETAKNKR